MVLIKIIVLIFSVIIGLMMMKYRERIVRLTGKSDWAERYLGTGGTYTVLIFFSFLIIIIAVVWLVGTPWG